MKLHLQVAEVAIQRAGIAFDLLAEGWDRIFDLEIPNLEHFEVRFALLGIRFWASYRLCNLEIPNLEHLEIRRPRLPQTKGSICGICAKTIKKHAKNAPKSQDRHQLRRAEGSF